MEYIIHYISDIIYILLYYYNNYNNINSDTNIKFYNNIIFYL